MSLLFASFCWQCCLEPIKTTKKLQWDLAPVSLFSYRFCFFWSRSIRIANWVLSDMFVLCEQTLRTVACVGILLFFFFEVVVCSFFCWDVFFSRSKNNEWFLERAASDLLFWSLFLWTISVFETIFGCVVFCFFTSQDVKMNIRSLTNPSSLPRFLSPRLVVLVQISLHFFKNTRKIAEEKRELKKVGMHYHYQKY